MITCRTCEERKAPDSFYKSNRTQCKECVKDRVRKYREENLDAIQEYDRQRGLLEHRKAAVKARAHRYKRNVAEIRARNPEKSKARIALGNAVRDGKVIKASGCEECGSSINIQGHHDDYSKPLDVRWLCSACHGRHHREENEKMRQEARQ